MNNPEDIDIDVSDFDEKPKDRPDDLDPKAIQARHDQLGREYAAARAKEDAGFRIVAEGFFAKNPFLVERFNADPEAMQRFKLGLKSLVVTSAMALRCDPSELPSKPQFQKDLLIFSVTFEDNEKARKLRGGRRAA